MNRILIICLGNIFQDLRYALSFSIISDNWANRKFNIFDDEKFNIGNHDNELNELIDGIGKAAKSFTDVLLEGIL